MVSGLKKSVVLVGLMGAGKTRIGRSLADKLRCAFVDSDREIEIAAGCSVADIFEIYGEEAFRDVEHKVLDRLLTEPAQVIATGGGAFIRDDNRAIIQAKGTSIWLDADIKTLVERTSRTSHRPLLKQGNPEQILMNLLEKRKAAYARAHIRVDSGDRPIHNILEDMVEQLKSLDVL